MVFGYNSKYEMLKYNKFDENLLKKARQQIKRKSSPRKKCVGGFNGKYYYEDGSKDDGIEYKLFKLEADGDIFLWEENFEEKRVDK